MCHILIIFPFSKMYVLKSDFLTIAKIISIKKILNYIIQLLKLVLLHTQYYYHLLLIHNTNRKFSFWFQPNLQLLTKTFCCCCLHTAPNFDSTKCKNFRFFFRKYSLVSRFFKIFFLNPRLYGFSCFRFQYCKYIEQNKSSTICFLGTNLEHCTFYHFYFAQAQYPRQKKRDE